MTTACINCAIVELKQGEDEYFCPILKANVEPYKICDPTFIIGVLHMRILDLEEENGKA